MNHEYYRDRVSAFFDEALSAEEMQMMAAHLEECPDCRALLRKLADLDQLVAKKSAFADDNYWEQAARRIDAAIVGSEQPVRQARRRPEWWGLRWKLATVAASVAVLMLIGLNRERIFSGLETTPVLKLESTSPVLDSAGTLSYTFAPAAESVRTASLEDVEAEVAVNRGGSSEQPVVVDSIKPEGLPTLSPAMNAAIEVSEPEKDEAKMTDTNAQATSNADVAKHLGDVAEVMPESLVVQAPTESYQTPPADKLARPKAGADQETEQSMDVVTATRQELTAMQASRAPTTVAGKGTAAGFSLTVDSLSYWRHQRDSLRTLVFTADTATQESGRDSAARAPYAEVRIRAYSALVTMVPEFPDRIRRLVEAWYQVAWLTDDSKEREEAMQNLDWWSLSHQLEADLARDYLAKLKASRN
jgi:hypothetical protein